MSVNKKYSETASKLGTYVFSAVTGSAVSAAVLLLCAFVMYAFSLPVYWAGFFSLFSLACGCIVCGFVCGRIKRRKGLRNGFYCALIMSALVIVGSLISGSFDGSLAAAKLLTAVITACIGGISGVNSFKYK